MNTESYVYFAIRDEDGKEHPIPPFVTTPREIATEPESEKIADMKLKLKDIGEVLDYLNPEKINAGSV